MDKRERALIRGQLAHLNRDAEIFAGRVSNLEIKKVWSVLAHLSILAEAVEIELPSNVLFLKPPKLRPVVVWAKGRSRVSCRPGRLAA